VEVFVPLLPGAKLKELLLDARKTRRGGRR
jgi:hypothetical protein